MEKHNCKKCINVCDCCAFKNSRYRCIKCIPCGEKFIPKVSAIICPKDSSIISTSKTHLFKRGDIVKVRKDLQPLTNYFMLLTRRSNTVVDQMFKFLGQEVQILETHEWGYSIYEDSEMWTWTDEMFELEDYDCD